MEENDENIRVHSFGCCDRLFVIIFRRYRISGSRRSDFWTAVVHSYYHNKEVIIETGTTNELHYIAELNTSRLSSSAAKLMSR